jgi:hypothetical protein
MPSLVMLPAASYSNFSGMSRVVEKVDANVSATAAWPELNVCPLARLPTRSRLQTAVSPPLSLPSLPSLSSSFLIHHSSFAVPAPPTRPASRQPGRNRRTPGPPRIATR